MSYMKIIATTDFFPFKVNILMSTFRYILSDGSDRTVDVYSKTNGQLYDVLELFKTSSLTYAKMLSLH